MLSRPGTTQFSVEPRDSLVRKGELRALRVSNLHGLDGGDCWIEVEHGWDDVEGEIAPKSRAGVRSALMPETLRALLAGHVRRTGRCGGDFVFGATATRPFSPSRVRRQAIEAWTAAELQSVTLHELRHGFRSFLDAAGISEARGDRYLGHAADSIGRRYTHALRGQLAEDARRLDAYLTRGAAVVVPFPTAGARPAREQREAETG